MLRKRKVKKGYVKFIDCKFSETTHVFPICETKVRARVFKSPFIDKNSSCNKYAIGVEDIELDSFMNFKVVRIRPVLRKTMSGWLKRNHLVCKIGASRYILIKPTSYDWKFTKQIKY